MSTDPPRIVLKRIAFTGPKVPTRSIEFSRGLTLIFGASNTGKSFVVKSLNFMTGGDDPLPRISELEGYDRGWLEADLPTTGSVLITRATSGKEFGLFRRPAAIGTTESPDATLSAKHTAKKIGSLSALLLNEIGIGSVKIASNENAKLASFTFRSFAPYIFIDENAMISENNPIQISPRNSTTFDKNVFKYIVTGVDDSGVIQTSNTSEQKAANKGKIELVEEMLRAAQDEFGREFKAGDELVEQEQRLDASLDGLHGELHAIQDKIDALRKTRRSIAEAKAMAEDRSVEIGIAVERFDILKLVYDSDERRLESLEEGGAALLAGFRRPCPLCGADPAQQRHAHGLDHVETARKAASAEIAKIRAERADLGKTAESLRAERDGLIRSIASMADQIVRVDRQIADATPSEVAFRSRFDALSVARERVKQGLLAQRRIEWLNDRRRGLEAFRARRVKSQLVVGVSGEVGHRIAMKVQSVLQSWNFPGQPQISFDPHAQDIRMDGKDRNANGKGVRALTNAAFKIGVLMYCRERGLPHPGTILLDSPLLSYREPDSKHGPLSGDELTIKESRVANGFYRFLQEYSATAQFIVLENRDPPFALATPALTTYFSGPPGQEGVRAGFF